jgi:hypothetical protein
MRGQSSADRSALPIPTSFWRWIPFIWAGLFDSTAVKLVSDWAWQIEISTMTEVRELARELGIPTKASWRRRQLLDSVKAGVAAMQAPSAPAPEPELPSARVRAACAAAVMVRGQLPPRALPALCRPFSVLSLSPPMATLSHTAALLLSSLETAERSNGSPFLRLSSSAPSWASSVIREAHLSELPNDSRYELIRDALSALSDGAFSDEEEALDSLSELSLDLVPCATSELLQWFADHVSRLSSCDEALESGRISDLCSYELLSEGFRVGAEEMLSSLISSLEEERLSVFNPDTDSQLLLGDSHGIYIPKLWADELKDEEEAESYSVSWEDVLTCQAGPESESYWQAWDAILRDALWNENGEDWRLLQNGDLWAVRSDVEIPEDAF